MTSLLCNATRTVRTPQGYKVKAQSYNSLEKIAIDVRNILTKTGIIDSDGAIDCLKLLEEIIPRFASVDYSIKEDEAMEGCAAFVIPERNLMVVSLSVYNGLFSNSNYSRSTIVHELSHLALEHAVTLHRGLQTTKHQFYEDTEWQAKALTAAIMMPIEICQEHVHDPHSLARRCKVSEQAAEYRLDRLIKDKKISPQGFIKGFL